MKYFKSQDDRIWKVRLDNGLADAAGLSKRVGWEAVLFETVPAGIQRIVYRPAGWLDIARAEDLGKALQEAESVRTRWESPPAPPAV